MIFYHLQHYFALDDEWHDIPHVNGGCSSCKSDVYEVYERLINLKFTRVNEFRVILSGSDSYLPLPKPQLPLFTQLTLF